jgi:hypothetical protein
MNRAYIGVGVSSNGDRIAYGSANSGKSWYISFWNGTNYNNGTIFRTSDVSGAVCRTAIFNNDSSILFLSYYSNPSGCVEYGYYNPNFNLYYDSFSYIANSLIPSTIKSNSDAGGLYIINNNLYVTINNSPTIFSVSIFPEYPRPFMTGNNGITFCTWFRSDVNALWSRIFDFGNNAAQETIVLAFYSNNSTVYIPSTDYSPLDKTTIPYSGDGRMSGLMLGTYRNDNGNTYHTQPELTWSYLYPINNNNWYHIAFSLSYVGCNSPTSNLIVYLNGNVVSNTYTHVYPKNINRVRSYIGASNWIDPEMFGALKEFRFYNSVLSPNQILQIYNNDPIIYSNNTDITKTPIYTQMNTPVDYDMLFFSSSINMGTGITYRYWNDTMGIPYDITNICNPLINIYNPIKFSYTYNNTSNLPRVLVYNFCDNEVKLFINGVDTGIRSGAWVGAVASSSANILSGNNLFDFYCVNSGGFAYFAAYVTDASGNYLFSTTRNHNGWNASMTGFFIKNVPMLNGLISKTAPL